MCQEIQHVVKFCEKNPKVCLTVLSSRATRNIQTLNEIKEIDKFWQEECLAKYCNPLESGKHALSQTVTHDQLVGLATLGDHFVGNDWLNPLSAPGA